MNSNARNKAGNSGDTSLSVGECGTYGVDMETSPDAATSLISLIRRVQEKEVAIETCEADIREASETIVDRNAKIDLLVQEINSLKFMEEQKINAEYLVNGMRNSLGNNEIIFKDISEVITHLAPEMAKVLKKLNKSQLKDAIVQAIESVVRADCTSNLNTSDDSDPVVFIRNKHDIVSMETTTMKEIAVPKADDLKKISKCNDKILDKKAFKSNRNFPLDKPGIILDDITLSSDEGEMESEEIAKDIANTNKSIENIVEIDVTQDEDVTAGNTGIDPISSQFGKLAIKKMKLAQLTCEEDV